MTTTPTSPIDLLARSVALRAEALTVEADAIRAALDAVGWLVRPAARQLGLAHTTLIRRLARHPSITARLAEIAAARAGATASAHARTCVRTGEVGAASGLSTENAQNGATESTHLRPRRTA